MKSRDERSVTKLTEPHYVGLPPPLNPAITETRNYFQALDNFFRVFAIKPGDRVLMLTDTLLDRRVVDAISGLAKSRGASVNRPKRRTG